MSKEQENKLLEFFRKNIDIATFAKYVRRFKQETIHLVLECKDDQLYNKEWISDGHYWLTELCEIIDPNLEKE